MLLNDWPELVFELLVVPPLEPPPLPLPLPPLLGVVDVLATEICNDFWADLPLASETDTANVKLPLAPGVPEIVPVLSLRPTPPGNCPDDTENL